MRPGRHCAGAKVWNSEIWRLLANWRLHCRTDLAGICIRYLHTQLNVLFVTVHTNAIAVTIRISVADLIGGGLQHRRLPPGWQTPSRHHCCIDLFLCFVVYD